MLQTRKEPFNVAHVFEFSLESNGKLVLNYKGTQPKPRKRINRVVAKDNDVEMNGQMQIGIKRDRLNHEFDEWTKEIEQTHISTDEEGNDRYKQFESQLSMIIFQTIQRRKSTSRNIKT